jgi:hypothetical protein
VRRQSWNIPPAESGTASKQKARREKVEGTRAAARAIAGKWGVSLSGKRGEGRRTGENDAGSDKADWRPQSVFASCPFDAADMTHKQSKTRSKAEGDVDEMTHNEREPGDWRLWPSFVRRRKTRSTFSTLLAQTLGRSPLQRFSASVDSQ